MGGAYWSSPMDPIWKGLFITRGQRSDFGQRYSMFGPLSPDEANCAEGQEAGGVSVRELTFPRDLEQQDFLTWDCYYLSHITWPDLLPAIINSASMTKTFI